MKKILFIVMVFMAQFAVAQQIKVTGTVKNAEGGLLTNIIIRDKFHKTRTDTAGNFAMAVDSNGTLSFSGVGYRDTTINVNGQTSITVIMRGSVTINGGSISNNATFNKDAPSQNINMQYLAERMNDLQELAGNLNQRTALNIPHVGGGTLYVQRDFVDMAQGAIFPQFNPKEETQGSRYYFKGWVQGVVLNNKNEVIQNPKYLFNYDKMGGGLLLSQDAHSAIEVNREQVKYFVLVDEIGNKVTFANLPVLDKTHYVEVINEGSKINIYKVIKTKFERANYSTDGLTSSGNNFDSYEDHFDYYIVDVKTGKTQLVELKKKSIKNAFSAYDADKTSKFLSDHADETADDMYLASLAATINE